MPKQPAKPLLPGTIVDGQLCVSNSLLKDVATCDTKAYLSWVLRKTVAGEFGPMLLGSAVHLALASYFKGGTAKAARLVLRDAYKAWAETNIDPEDKFNARLGWENVRRVFRYWLKQHSHESFQFTVDPNLVEVPFAAPLAPGIVLRGILDMLVRHRESNKLYVLDHKTTSAVNAWWIAQFKLESQIVGYIFGVQEQTDEEVVGGYINAIPFGLLPGLSNPHWKCRAHGVTYDECQSLHVGGDLLMVPASTEKKAVWKLGATALASRYRALLESQGTDPTQTVVDKLHVQGMFNGSCRMCVFLDWCRNGRRVDLITTMLVDRPQDQEAYYE